jgi:hypothetical protein
LYKGNKIETVNDFNYLGTVFNYTGSFVLNQETIVGKALKAMNILLVNIKKLSLSTQVKCQLFDAFVGSILSYGCEAWGFGKSKIIERVHLKFCKTILKVKNSTCSNGVYGDLGRYPLYVNRHVRIIKFWCKVVQSDNIIIKFLYKDMLEQYNNGKRNWASNVKTLLDSYGYSNVFDNPSEMNLCMFHREFKLRVIDVFKQHWINSIDQSTSLPLYNYFKPVFGQEQYLNKLPVKSMVAISKLRLSSHCLRIVTSRYTNNRIPLEERLCTLCNLNEIEDEFHLVLKCPVYNDLRKRFIRNVYTNRPSVFKFISMLQTNDMHVLHNLGKFFNSALERKRTLITYI